LGILIETMKRIIPVGSNIKLKNDLTNSIKAHGGAEAKKRMAGKLVYLSRYETNKVIIRETVNHGENWTIVESDIDFDINEMLKNTKNINILFNVNNLDIK